MEAFIELKDYLKTTYRTDKARHQKFQYHVGRDKFELTIYCNDETAKKHCDNLGLTLIEGI